MSKIYQLVYMFVQMIQGLKDVLIGIKVGGN
jgi:hypothetical protein